MNQKLFKMYRKIRAHSVSICHNAAFLSHPARLTNLVEVKRKTSIFPHLVLVNELLKVQNVLWVMKKSDRNPPTPLCSLDFTEWSRDAKRQLLCLCNRYWGGWEPEPVNMRLFYLSVEGCSYSIFLARRPAADSHHNVTCACPSFKPYPWGLGQLLIHPQAQPHELQVVTDREGDA